MNKMHTISVPYSVMKTCPLSWVQRVHAHKGNHTHPHTNCETKVINHKGNHTHPHTNCETGGSSPLQRISSLPWGLPNFEVVVGKPFALSLCGLSHKLK
jgi:hypothetical protein